MTRLEVAIGGDAAVIEAQQGEKLSKTIWLSPQAPANPLCNGLGRCGRCRVRFTVDAPLPCPEEMAMLAPEELAAGWRLACHHLAPSGGVLHLEIPAETPPQANESEMVLSGLDAYLGIDLGTTSIEWRLVDAAGSALAAGDFWNPQGGAGADVVSRLQAASNQKGLTLLSELIRKRLRRLAATLENAGASIKRACVAANSAMTEIFLQADISGLLAAPWSLSIKGGELVELALGRRPLPTVIPPLPAPFVGGDISAAIWALLRRQTPKPFLLIDMGTNAEVALLNENGQLWLASAPLGPALEGIGPACGQPASPGVITRFTLAARGLMPHFYGDVVPEHCRGISATGYISLLALLLNMGVMRPDGAFNLQNPMPVARQIASQLDNGRLYLPCGQYLTSFDVEMLLKVKAALAVAVRSVLAAGGIGAGSLKLLAIAGALGQFAPIADLATLGFIPPACVSQCVAVGNASLEGACLLAANPADLSELNAVCGRAITLNLAEEGNFMASYLNAMHWGY